MRKTLLSVCLASALIGCDAVNDIGGMFEKQKLAQEYVKKNYGLESQLGFNMNNGVLTDVTLVLNAKDVQERTISELESMVNKVVAEVFSSEPNVILIQVVIDTKQKP